MGRNVASVVRELDPEDIHLLSGVEHGMRFSEWVNRNRLPGFAGLTPEEVDYRIDRCLDRKLVERKTIQYEGIKLRMAGYDVLALHTFAERETIVGVGAPLGVGKESDVYEVQSYTTMALKFHREGYTAFRRVNRERDYTADRGHVSWLYTARKAAEREYERLEALYPTVSVPRPEDQNRHALVMARFEGSELSRTRLADDQVLAILARILRELSRAYAVGYVHADMSEYNVAISPDGITLFDWPQAVETGHENARELLHRDVDNVLGYFARKYPAISPSIDAESLLEPIMTGELESVDRITGSRS